MCALKRYFGHNILKEIKNKNYTTRYEIPILSQREKKNGRDIGPTEKKMKGVA